jgi:hypothetical protein
MTFTQWRNAVDAALMEMIGLTGDDLMDWDYWDCWNDAQCPRDVALDVMRGNGYGDFT